MAYRFGWIPDHKDERDFLYSMPAAVVLPKKMDLRNLCPPVYDQGNLGSCTANAIAAAIEFDRMKQKLADFTPSRLFIYFNERVMEGDVKKDAGAQIRDGIKSVAKQGDCPESEWPYVISQFAVKPPDSCYADAIKYEVVKYERINNTVLAQMKACLAAGYPFVFGITVYSNFPMNTRTGAVSMPKGSIQGGHAILCVGYNDSASRFIFRNSWGTGWGAKGYGTIPYNYLTDANLAGDFWKVSVVM
jgi:C1A family cysteine protease